AGDDVLSTERHLLRFSEEVVDEPVEDEPSDAPDRHFFLGYDLGRVEDVERETISELLVEELEPKLPLGRSALVDSVPQVATVKIRVSAIDFDRFVPDHRLHPK